MQNSNQTNAALCKFKKEPLASNLNFILLRAKARKTIKEAKKISWQNYVSKLNSSTKTNTLQKMISKISGKNQSTPLKQLIKNNTQVKRTFLANYSSTNSYTEFHQYKDKKEKQKPNLKSGNPESYNELFSLTELKEATPKSHNTAVSPDEIHKEFHRQLPSKSLEYLLTTFNDIWKNSKLPELWKLATVIAIPKLGKNHLYVSNYRLIALTSFLCKIMERMVSKRLVWFIESNNLFTNFQCGFRSRRSTMNHVVR